MSGTRQFWPEADSCRFMELYEGRRAGLTARFSGAAGGGKKKKEEAWQMT